MRYDKGRKEASRRLIMEVATKRFREDCISASGIASIMSDMGLTNGAFYPHFESKEELVRECVSIAQIEQSKLIHDALGCWRPRVAYHNISVSRALGCTGAGMYFRSIVGRTISSVIRDT